MIYLFFIAAVLWYIWACREGNPFAASTSIIGTIAGLVGGCIILYLVFSSDPISVVPSPTPTPTPVLRRK